MIAAAVRGLFLLILISFPVFGANVALQWDPSPDSGLATYRVYRGAASGVYDWSIDVAATSTNAVVTNVVDGQIYFFAVSVFDTNGIESDLSNEIIYPPGSSTNVPPVAANLSVTTLEDQRVAITLQGTDANSDPLTYQITAAPAHGTLSGTGASVSYLPAANFFGTDQFTYTVWDGSVYSAPANVVISVQGVNDTPTLNSIANINIAKNLGAQTVSLSGIGSGAANEAQTLAVSASSSNPTLIPTPTVNYTSPNTSGTLAFTPAANVTGSSTITVKVDDGGTSNNIVTRTFTVTVWPPPTVSGLTETGSDARSLTFNWTTDQSATCTLDYGTTTNLGYSAASTTGTSHSATLTNLLPATTYYLRVRASSAYGNSQTTIQNAATEPVRTLLFGAESATTSLPMAVLTTSLAQSGKYIATTVQGSGSAVYSLNTQYGLNYRMWARVKTVLGAGSFYLSLDGSAEVPVTFTDSSGLDPWRWILVNGLVLPMNAATHRLGLRGGVANAGIDEFAVVNDPNWQPILPTTQPQLSLVASTSTNVDLSWSFNAGNATGVGIEIQPDGLVYSTAATNTTYRISNLNPLKSYSFRIYAFNQVERTAYSNSVSR